ncbi:hypothetical protein, partial [Streptomyces sp. NPDC056983]|uniref:hypothetical protein n=1 Tax=Streptomyces sp. NPDC056983 TaxID=3345987 RepID=UPI00362FB4FB
CNALERWCCYPPNRTIGQGLQEKPNKIVLRALRGNSPGDYAGRSGSGSFGAAGMRPYSPDMFNGRGPLRAC